ncbi:MAG: substrate-binding domain-containing protein, partial [Myxococcota bacterium]
KIEGRIVPTAHARATLAAVDHGQVDVAIVYATDARLSRSARVAFEVPEAEQPHIAYVAARVKNSQHRALANDFLDYLGNEATEAVLRVAGFRIPEDPP